MIDALTYPFELVTDRLLICSPAKDDAVQFRDAVRESLDTLKPWMPWATRVPTPEEALENCSSAAHDFKEGRDYRLHLFHKNSGAFVGGSGLHRFDWSVPKFEIGYWIRQSFSGEGYVTEAVSCITEFGLQRLEAERIEIRCSSLNAKSARIPEKLGYKLEGTLRNHSRHIDGSLEDTRIYARVAGD